jgi:hypothetical protein
LCTSSSGVIVSARNIFNPERIAIIQQLHLSEKTIRNLLLGMITKGMTTLMAEAALGQPIKVKKQFLEGKQIEIRCYENCVEGLGVYLLNQHYLELKFVEGVLDSWIEG